MKNSVLKSLLLLFVLINISCNNNDDTNCLNSNIPVDFTLKVKLVSPTGDNLLNDSDFNLSLLKLTDPQNENFEILFSQINESGNPLITFNGSDLDSVNFEYNGENKFYFGFHDVKSQIENCIVKVSSYKALKINGDLICDCNSEDILVITLDL